MLIEIKNKFIPKQNFSNFFYRQEDSFFFVHFYIIYKYII